MKKFLLNVVFTLAFVMMLGSCGLNSSLTSNTNVNQTNVVLSQKNYHIVKTVQATQSSMYIFGIGGLSKANLQRNAVAELTKKADLTGSQALINVTVKSSAEVILFYTRYTVYAEGTVIEFDR